MSKRHASYRSNAIVEQQEQCNKQEIILKLMIEAHEEYGSNEITEQSEYVQAEFSYLQSLIGEQQP